MRGDRRDGRGPWLSLGYALGIAVVIVLIIWLILVILPDPRLLVSLDVLSSAPALTCGSWGTRPGLWGL